MRGREALAGCRGAALTKAEIFRMRKIKIKWYSAGYSEQEYSLRSSREMPAAGTEETNNGKRTFSGLDKKHEGNGSHRARRATTTAGKRSFASASGSLFARD